MERTILIKSTTIGITQYQSLDFLLGLMGGHIATLIVNCLSLFVEHPVTKQ